MRCAAAFLAQGRKYFLISRLIQSRCGTLSLGGLACNGEFGRVYRHTFLQAYAAIVGLLLGLQSSSLSSAIRLNNHCLLV